MKNCFFGKNTKRQCLFSTTNKKGITIKILDIHIQASDLDSKQKEWEDQLKKSETTSIQIIIDDSNAEIADDILIWIKKFDLKDVRFSYQHSSTQNTLSLKEQNQKFHLAGFFDKLTKYHTEDLGQKQFYAKLAKQLAITPQQVEDGLHQPPNAKSVSATTKIKKEVKQILRPLKQKSKQLIQSFNQSADTLNIKPSREGNPQKWQNALITGWYGTETTGDKAILGEIIYTLRRYNPEIKITVTTIDHKVSHQTNIEMSNPDIDIVPIAKASDPSIIDRMDVVIMGGGPLMESRQIKNIWKIFKAANDQQKSRVIFGCGVGPIHTEPMKVLIGEICKMSTAGFFRDQPSREYALRLGADTGFPVACDPALAYVNRWLKNHGSQKAKNKSGLLLTTLLREQTKEYFTDGQLSKSVNTFIDNVAGSLDDFLKSNPTSQLDMMPMHMYWKGNDDRLFNRTLLNKLEQKEQTVIVKNYLDLDAIIARLYQADVAVAMRYHGHLFCLALGIPFLSVDYTGKKGKVSNLNDRIDHLNFAESFHSYTRQSAFQKMQELKENKATINKKLLDKTSYLLQGLEDAYKINWESHTTTTVA